MKQSELAMAGDGRRPPSLFGLCKRAIFHSAQQRENAFGARGCFQLRKRTPEIERSILVLNPLQAALAIAE